MRPENTEKSNEIPTTARLSTVATPVAPAAPTVAPAIGVSGFTDAQFERLVKGLVYSNIAAGWLTSRPGVTATPKNMETIKQLGDGVLELMK
jgi:hypothetical protein